MRRLVLSATFTAFCSRFCVLVLQGCPFLKKQVMPTCFTHRSQQNVYRCRLRSFGSHYQLANTLAVLAFAFVGGTCR